jgi:hypothetical protein
MAASLPIHLNLPADLYARIQEEAAHSDQPVEAVLIESLALLFGVPPVDWDHLTATLETLSDVQLWAVVYRRLAATAAGRLRDLTARGQQAPLSAEEQAELAALIDEVDRMTLLRSHALLVLQQRGHKVREQLQRGA